MYCPVVPSINHMLVHYNPFDAVDDAAASTASGVSGLAHKSTRRRRRAAESQHATSHVPRAQSTEYSHLLYESSCHGFVG